MDVAICFDAKYLATFATTASLEYKSVYKDASATPALKKTDSSPRQFTWRLSIQLPFKHHPLVCLRFSRVSLAITLPMLSFAKIGTILSLTSAAFAQTITTSLFFGNDPTVDAYSWDGSVVAVGPSANTYVVNCGSNCELRGHSVRPRLFHPSSLATILQFNGIACLRADQYALAHPRERA